MPLIFNEYVYEDCLLGIWEIEEDYETLYSQIKLYSGEFERLNGFKNHDRKLEWLSVRILLKELLGEQGQIVYNEKRKPFLWNTDYRISISHSRDLTAIILSKEHKIGLDLEYMSHRIDRIKHKFINESEYIIEDEKYRSYHMYIHWCAKEALYKICDKQDINFKKNLTLEPFEPEPSGEIMGWVDNIHWHDKFEMKYFSFKNYIIVYCYK